MLRNQTDVVVSEKTTDMVPGSVLISVYHKGDVLTKMVQLLHKNNTTIISTGGSYDFIRSSVGIKDRLLKVEHLTDFPEVLSGRVKTLHPKIFGGILADRSNETHIAESTKNGLRSIDIVIVDLYPFEEAVKNKLPHAEIIEKIDIGGIALIRAAAKNFNDVLVVPAQEYYKEFLEIYSKNNGVISLEDRRRFATYAFGVSSHYDTQIFNYFNQEQELSMLRLSMNESQTLRYGENPHQRGEFYGNLDKLFYQLNGKQLSYNNLCDVDAAISLLEEFSPKDGSTVVVIKHQNPCGVATDAFLSKAYTKAFMADPESAFGSIIAMNQTVDLETAHKMKSLFFEVLIAPDYKDDALLLLQEKKNLIILQQKASLDTNIECKTILNGVVVQSKDKELHNDLICRVGVAPSKEEEADILFALKVVKHLKSNGIAIVKNKELLGMGCGQVSRIDALNQAIAKAEKYKTPEFCTRRVVMASEAFFPFPDCVKRAQEAGIEIVVHPGGSKNDDLSVIEAGKNDQTLLTSGLRHFKH